MWRGYWRFLLPYRIGRCHRRAFAHSCSGARLEFDRFFLCEEQHRVLDAILHFLHSLYNPDGLKELIGRGGAPLICFIVFIETGFFVGFFLPGDSLLVTVGIFSAGGFIHMQRAHDFYEKYGGRAVILARFIPIVRTFCPPVAGAAKMPYASYVAFDICGGIFWVAIMILGGYTLGRSVPNIGARIHYVIAVVIVVSVLPAVISIYRSRHKFSASGDQSSAATPRAKGE